MFGIGGGTTRIPLPGMARMRLINSAAGKSPSEREGVRGGNTFGDLSPRKSVME